jgi:hypothetical protein
VGKFFLRNTNVNLQTGEGSVMPLLHWGIEMGLCLAPRAGLGAWEAADGGEMRGNT